jgi:zinc transporter
MATEGGLICAFLLDGRGGGREIRWPEIAAWRAEQGLLWAHLDRAGPDARRWLRQEAGLDPVVSRALLAEDVRPREVRIDDALLVTLRGVNLNRAPTPRTWSRSASGSSPCAS